MNPVPTRPPTATTFTREQSPVEWRARLRSSRRKVSGTRMVGRNAASRGPVEDRRQPRPRLPDVRRGFASRTTVVSRRFGRFSVPTSTTEYSAAG